MESQLRMGTVKDVMGQNALSLFCHQALSAMVTAAAEWSTGFGPFE